jgi:hypothetical protein
MFARFSLILVSLHLLAVGTFAADEVRDCKNNPDLIDKSSPTTRRYFEDRKKDPKGWLQDDLSSPYFEKYRFYLIREIGKYFTGEEPFPNKNIRRVEYAFALFAAFKDKSASPKFRLEAYEIYLEKVHKSLNEEEIESVKFSLRKRMSDDVQTIPFLLPALFLTVKVDEPKGKAHILEKLWEDGRTERKFPPIVSERVLETLNRYNERNPFPDDHFQRLVVDFFEYPDAGVRIGAAAALVRKKEGNTERAKELFPSARARIRELAGPWDSIKGQDPFAGKERIAIRGRALSIMRRNIGAVVFGVASESGNTEDYKVLINHLVDADGKARTDVDNGIQVASIEVLEAAHSGDIFVQRALLTVAFHRPDNANVSYAAFVALGVDDQYEKPAIENSDTRTRLVEEFSQMLMQKLNPDAFPDPDPQNTRLISAATLIDINRPDTVASYGRLLNAYNLIPGSNVRLADVRSRIGGALGGNDRIRGDGGDGINEILPNLVAAAARPTDGNIRETVIGAIERLKPRGDSVLSLLQRREDPFERDVVLNHIENMSEERFRDLVSSFGADTILAKILNSPEVEPRRRLLVVFNKWVRKVAFSHLTKVLNAIVRNMTEPDFDHPKPLANRVPRMATFIISTLVTRVAWVPFGEDHKFVQNLIRVAKGETRTAEADLSEVALEEKRLAQQIAHALIVKIQKIKNREYRDSCTAPLVSQYLEARAANE